MPEISGVSIAAVTAFGCSDDGQHVWITHRLGGGDEYRLIYSYVSVGHLTAMLGHAARLAYERRAARDPQEATEGMNSTVMPVAEVRLAVAPENAGAMLHLTTADKIPVTVEIPVALLADLATQLQQVIDSLPVTAGNGRGRLH